jgi:hypothetical protein
MIPYSTFDIIKAQDKMKTTKHAIMKTGVAAPALAQPVVMVTNHEPLMFRRRVGSGTDAAEPYAYEHSEAAVEALARRGVTWHRTHFYKGFGLQAEREELERTKRFVQLCHRHGIKVEVYIQWGTLQYETLLAECPDMLDWCVVTEEGRYAGINYSHQYFRYRPCTVREGFWKYLRKVIDTAIDEVKADGLGFDNVADTTEPESCHCPQCRAAFVAFLKRKYRVNTAEGRRHATERFGFAVLDHISPPTFNRWNAAYTCREIRDPVMQEWIDFRCANHTKRVREVWEYVKARVPQVVVEHNLYPGMGFNQPWWSGTSLTALLPYLDVFWDEMSPGAPNFRNGVLLHRAHSMKLAETAGRMVFTSNDGSTPDTQHIAIAENLAFNQGHPSVFGWTTPFARGKLPASDSLIAFRQAHDALFAGTTSAAQVGIFESDRSLRLNLVEPHYAEVLAFQSLLAGHVPFGLLTALDETILKRYAVLILPDAECLNEDEAARIVNYVRQGGGLVLTGRTGQYDHWRRQRPVSLLAPLLESAPEGKDAPRRATFGRGRVVWLPRLEPTIPYNYASTDWAILPRYWHLPKNHAAFLKAVSWAFAGRSLVEITAPLGVAAETRRTSDGRLLVHLLDYDSDRRAAAASITVRGMAIGSAWRWTPNTGNRTRPIRMTPVRDCVRLTPCTIRRYAIVEVIPVR